ncbi:MAG: HAMP domain-containing histidine kinase [Gemmatimonadetes bacterium]|nr:HAMP domain-containing histidine kinase [Gemmatimonadota bacterium]
MRTRLPPYTGRHWKEPGFSRSLPLAVLVLTLALSGVLAYQAQDAARSHRAASENTLRDYGAFASWELGRRIEESARQTLSGALTRGIPSQLTPVGKDAEAAVSDYLRWTGPAMERCRCPGATHDFFYLNVSDGRLAVRESRLTPADREWIREQVSARRSAPAPRAREVRIRGGGSRVVRRIVETQPVAWVSLPGRPSKSLLYTTATDEDGVTSGVYGLVLDLPEFTRSVIGGILAETPLLPPTLTHGAPNEAVLAIAVSSLSGEPIFRSRGVLNPTTMVVDTVGGDFGRLVIRVGVRPEMADGLLIGGLPRSRLPLLLGVLCLTLVLGVVALVQLRRQQELARMRSGFVSGVSHELRTPLAQIRLFADLLDSGRLREPERARSVRIISDEARRLSYLVENVLRFARSEQGAGQVAPAPADVAEVVRETVESFAPLAAARGAALELTAGAGAYASVDPDAMRQVLLNLLDNAVKYGPDGQRVRIGVERRDAQVRIMVDDEGPGIPEADREQVWHSFKRLSREAEAATGGSGIGLAVVRDLVAMHGGAASVEDAPGGGARFVVSLPALPAAAEYEDAPARLEAVRGGAA